MTCDSILKLIPLYYYGELTPDEEERVEEHTHGCPACTRELVQQRALAAARQQIERHIAPFRVQRRVPGFFRVQCALAKRAAVQMLLQILFRGEIQFSVKIWRKISLRDVAVHTKSPSAARIFWVARNRQFLAASSVVPSISPMFRNRRPW